MHHSTHGNSDGHHWYADFILILCFLMTHSKGLSQAHTIVYLKKYNSKIPTFTPSLLNQNFESLSTICRLQEKKCYKKRPPLIASQYSFAGLIRRAPPPTFSDTAITDRHSETTIFQLRAHWVRISWSVGSEKSFGHVPPVGVEPSTSCMLGEHPIH